MTHRKLMLSKAIAIESDLRGTLRNFGLKVGMVGTVKFEARIKELIENLTDLAVLIEPLLVVRRVLREQGRDGDPCRGRRHESRGSAERHRGGAPCNWREPHQTGGLGCRTRDLDGHRPSCVLSMSSRHHA